MTNWHLIRDVMNAAIDACEAIDELQISEQDRSRVYEESGVESGSVWDFLQSSWIAPENMSYSVIRARSQLGQEAPYVNEMSRILYQVGRLTSELVGAEDTSSPVSVKTPFRQSSDQSIESMVGDLSEWYRAILVPSLEKIMAHDHHDSSIPPK